MLNSSAAGNLHSHNCDASYVVVCNNLCKLFRIVNCVKLRTSYQCDFSFYKFLVEVCICISGAVCGNKKLCSAEIRCVYWRKLYLYRPLLKSADRYSFCRKAFCFGNIFSVKSFCLTAGTSAGNFCLLCFLFHIGFYSLFIICGGFTFYKGYCSCGTGGQTVAQTVAVIVTQKLCLSVYHADSTFVTSLGAGSASVAFLS